MLPPSELVTEVVEFHPMQKVSYNVLAALVASNVYTSQSRPVKISELLALLLSPFLGNFQDKDYFLHPKNTKSFKAVIRNFHLATFWYSARHMGVEKCLERTRFHLGNNKDLDDNARAALQEAENYLQTALETPGWVEWMEHAVSAPYEVSASDIPAEISMSWSDSPGDRPDLVGADSLKSLRDLNYVGLVDEDLEEAGDRHRSLKVAAAIAEDENDETINKDNISPKKQPYARQIDPEVTDVLQSAAHAPTAVRKGVISKQKDRKRDAMIYRLDEASRNALQDISSIANRVRPMPSTIQAKTCSAKLNFVIEALLSRPEDKFVIFGDLYELGHLTEALDLLDIKSSALKPCRSTLNS